MDLNEKLAARRRELGIEAEKAKVVEETAINAEVSKRLSEQGITQPTPVAIPNRLGGAEWVRAPIAVPKSTVDAEVEKALSKAASDRMTSGENTKFTVLLVLGLISLFVAWPMGVGFIVWAMIFISKTTARYKEKIIAEGKSNISKLQETRLAAEQGNTAAQNDLS